MPEPNNAPYVIVYLLPILVLGTLACAVGGVVVLIIIL